MTAKQYERMNKKNKNEHFPVLNEAIKTFIPTDDSKVNNGDMGIAKQDRNLK